MLDRVIRWIQRSLSIFVRVTTAVVIVTAIYIVSFWGADCEVGIHILWEILSVSALCALCSFVLPDDNGKVVSKRGMLIRIILYYAMVNVIVMTCGFVYEWFYVSQWKMVAGMEICIIAVFVIVTAVNYFLEYQTAERMNRKLKERQ